MPKSNTYFTFKNMTTLSTDDVSLLVGMKMNQSDSSVKLLDSPSLSLSLFSLPPHNPSHIHSPTLSLQHNSFHFLFPSVSRSSLLSTFILPDPSPLPFQHSFSIISNRPSLAITFFKSTCGSDLPFVILLSLVPD